MVQKLSYTANSITLGAGTSKVVLGADSGNLIVKDSQANTSILEPGLGIQGGAAVKTYANPAALPFSPISSAGTLAYTTSTGALYMSNGSGWYKVTLVNTAPSITLSSTTASPSLNSLTLDFTYTVAEPEGTPVTVTLANSGIATTGNVAITHTTSNNHIRLVFDGTTAYAGDATVTLTVTDGVNTGAGTITITTAYYDGTNSRFNALLMKANGAGNNDTLDDASTGNHTITANGDITQGSFSPFRENGYSIDLDGSSDYLTAPNSDDFTLTGVFTVEMWVYLDQTSYARTVQRLITPSTGNPASEPYISIGNDQGGVNAGCLCFTSSVGAGNPQGYATYEGTGATGTNRYFPFKQWVHVALTRDGSNVCRLFQDGVIVATVTISGGFDFNGANNGGITISKSGWNNAEFFGPGKITDFRMVKGTAVYTSAFTPPTEPLTAVTNTKLLLGAKTLIRDSSTSSHAITKAGTPITQAFSPYDRSDAYSGSDGGSVYFDGTSGNWLAVADSDDLNVGTGDFTLECWIKPESGGTGGYGGIFGSYAYSTNMVQMQISNTGRLRFVNPSTIASAGSTDMRDGKWHHVAMCRSGSTLRGFVDGVQEISASYSSSIDWGHNSNGAVVGITDRTTYPTNYIYKGFLASLRLVKGTALYTSAFTPPSSLLTAISNTKLLLNFGDAKVFDATQTAKVKLTGPVASSGQQHFSENTVFFDGSNDHIVLDGDVINDFGTEDWTMEGFIYALSVDADTQYRRVISFGDNGTDSIQLYILPTGGVLVYTANDSSIKVTGTTNIANAWKHFVIQRHEGVVRLYVDGSEEDSPGVADANDKTQASGQFMIGKYPGFSGYFHGYLHDFRITKGFTRYPFVPAKQTLTTTNTQRSGVTVTASNVTLLTCHTGSAGSTTITDGSSNSTSITRNGNAVVSDFAPATGMKSVFFDGTGDYLQCTLADTLGTADWTVEYWVWHNSISGNQIHCAFNGYAPAFYRRNSSNAFAVYHNGGVASPYYNTNITPVANKWYHMAYCHDDSEGKMTIFINGAQADEFSYSGNINGTTFRIGDDGTSAWMNGYISNLRIVKNTVVYTKNFTPTTSALQ